MGDKIEVRGDAVGSAIGRDAKVKARDITVSKLDEDLSRILKAARDALDSSDLSKQDKADAEDDLAKLVEEMQKPEPDYGRFKRYWDRIKDVAPPVASILASAESIAKIVQCFGT